VNVTINKPNPSRRKRKEQTTFLPCRYHLTDDRAKQGGIHAKQQPGLLGTTENELGIRKWLEDAGHTLVTTSDKEGPNSVFEKELVDAEVIITTPYVEYIPTFRLAELILRL
jgi:hypothetical protein